MKTQRTFESRPTAQLKAHAGYREAIRKLEELTQQLQPHKTEANRIEMQLTRASAAARQYVTRSVRLFRSLDTAEWDAVWRKVIAQGFVDPHLLQELCPDTPKPQIDEDDLRTIRALENEQAVIELLKRAIELQEKEVRAQKRLAIQQISASLKDDRRRLINKLAEGMIQLGQAIAEEKALDAWLANIEPDLVATITPRLFPTNIFANSEVIEWLSQCSTAGLLTNEQIQSLDETISFPRTAVSA